MNKPRVFGIVPARMGSGCIPNKNIRELAGKPLLGWAIEGGLKSGVLDKVILLTDSEEYANIGKKHGAEVPWLRSAELSTDTSPIVDVLKWCLEELKKMNDLPDYIALLEPTAPGRQPEHIKKLVELVVNSKADSG